MKTTTAPIKLVPLIKTLRVLCMIGECFAAVGMAAVVLMLPLSEALLKGGRANVGLYAGHGSLDWSFKLRLLPHSNTFIGYDSANLNTGVEAGASPQPDPAMGRMSLGPFLLRNEKGAFSLDSSDAGAPFATLNQVEGIVTLTRPEAAARAFASLKWPFAVSLLCTGAATLAILELFRRMLQSVENQEVFSSANIRNVYMIGYLLVAATLMKLLAAVWMVVRMADFVAQNVSAGNMAIGSSTEGGPYGLTAGVIVLVLAEVFRQGLALKEENQLTI